MTRSGVRFSMNANTKGSKVKWNRIWPAAVVAATVMGACNGDLTVSQPPGSDPADSRTPVIERTVFLSGLSNPWDMQFLPNGELLFTERAGRVRLRRTNGAVVQVAQISDVVASGEGGLLGLTLDRDFASNRLVYTCFSSNRGGANDNRIVRWRLADDGASLESRTDIVTGLPWGSNGRHSGCRPRFGPDGFLWVGTGDAANGTNPQNLASLGGKTLRLTRDGAAAPGNPTIVVNGTTADRRIYTYGHRNVQGVAFRPSDGAVFVTEHGPSFDDEATRLTAGANAGWNPVPGYNESVPMTDLVRYPDAMRPVWKSGAPARGVSGATFITGQTWGSWNGALAIAQLVGAKLVVLVFNTDGSVKSETNLFADQGTRLRVPVMGPDGALYIATDVGGGNGAIWRVVPRAP
ncbi:MAG TPA: PQQ-dependent sugar dehydrogenase [Gemmatimonas sp.]|nr:PQQ-dependent sugar dehydrogenase [Gemmatimonas sp.]